MVVLPAAKWPGLVPAGDTAIDCVESAARFRPSPKDERLGSLAGTEPALPWYAPEVDRQDGLANASPRANTQPAKIGTHQDRTINTRTLPGAAHDIVTPTRSFCRNRARRHGGLWRMPPTRPLRNTPISWRRRCAALATELSTSTSRFRRPTIRRSAMPTRFA